MRLIYSLFITLLMATGIHAQVVTIYDLETNEPLEAVTISSIDASVFAFTDANGKADIAALKGIDSIQIRLIGFETEFISFFALSDRQFYFGMKPSAFNLSQVVVSASRWEQSKREIPARISSITAKDVQFQNPQTAADLLGTSGEVYIQKSQLGGGSPMIRGFSTNRILIVVDGIRMNNAIFRGGNVQNVIALDPFSIEGTEVMFGPGSVIYGSDAIGGVMSFQTLEPWLSFSDKVKSKVNAGVRYATANEEKTAHFDLRLSGRNWGSVTGVTYTDYGDQRMGSKGRDEYLRPFYVDRIGSEDILVENENPTVQTPTGYHQTNFLQKFRYTPSDHWDIEYGFHFSLTGDVPRYDRLIRTRNGLPRSAEWNYGPQKWIMNNLHITHQASNRVFDKLSARIALQQFEESRIDRDFNDLSRRTREEQVDVFSASIDFQKSLNSTDEIYYGVEALYNKVKSSGERLDIQTGVLTGTASRYPASDYQSYAAYLTYKKVLSPLLTMQVGTRYNYILLQSTFDNTYFTFPFDEANLGNGALTGTLGFVFEPDEDWLFRASLATGFRSPNVDDVGKVFDSEPGSVVVPNPNLKPEYAYNAEISLTRNISNQTSVFINAYYTYLDNALVRRDFQINGLDSIEYDGELSQVQAIQNAATANVYGIELGANIKLNKEFHVTGRFNYQRGREELDNGAVSTSRHAPPPYGTLKLSYRHSKLRLEASTIFNSAVPFEKLAESERGKAYLYATDGDGNPFSPSWMTFNLRGSYAITDQINLTLGLENITDQRYRPYSSGIVAAGRNLIVSLKGSF